MSDTTDSTVRLLRLLTLLQEHAVWTGPELSERLGVSVRGVRRDITRLRELGYPVNSERGLGGGYRLAAGKAMPPLVLDDGEAVAVAVSLSLAAGGTVSGVEEDATRALAKLDQVVPARLRERIDAFRAATVRISAGSTPVDAAALTALARACRDHVQARFGYRRASQEREAEPTSVEEPPRRVEPYRLVATGRRWYLLAFDLDRDDWRVFRLDRMSQVHATTWRFSPREAPDAAERVRAGTSRLAYAVQTTIRVHADAQEVLDRVGPMNAQVEPEGPGRCVMRTGGQSLEVLAGFLAFLPWEVRVLDPPELQETVTQLGERLQRAGSAG